MTRRIGATLIEVLVTIFVMALGLIALLTLFPIGALRMAEAIKDSRSALAAANAEAIAAARLLRNDNQIGNRYQQPAAGSPAAPLDGPSYPVYLDPIGWRLYSANASLQNWVSGSPPGNVGIPRRTAQFIINAGIVPNQIRASLTSFSLLDDLTFGPDGVPIDAGGRRFGQPGFTELQREGRYSWGLMLKRPRTSTPSVVDMTVVVYSGRPLQLLTGLAAPQGENFFSASEGEAGRNTIKLTWSAGQERPNIKKGAWILDDTSYNLATPQFPQSHRDLALRHGPVHGVFYRVTNIASETNAEMVLQLETPLKADIGLPRVGVTLGYTPRFTVMDNVAEVFEKGPGWLP